jgi:phosphatidylinositol alpha-1,6-mannosyltransferase
MDDGRRPRVLIITKNFPPHWGGMEKLNWHLVEEIARFADVHVVGPAGAAAIMPNGITAGEVAVKPLWRFLVSAQIKALRIALGWKPDIVIAGSGLTAPLAWFAARCSRAKAVAYIHGLDVAVPHRGYRFFWLPFLRHLDRVISNSQATTKLAVTTGVDRTRIRIVHPGVVLPADDHNVDDIRADLDLRARPILLSVGRLTQRKGLREFVSDVLPRVALNHPEVILLVAGDSPTHSLYAQAQTPQSIQAAADKAGVGNNIRFLGVISDVRKLGAIYRAADVHVFTVREIPNDPEGFGMVALEAAAHGLPTVAYATGGVPEAVCDGITGVLVRPGDSEGFAQAIIAMLDNRHESDMRDRAMRHAQNFSWGAFGSRVAEALADYVANVRSQRNRGGA